MVDHSISTLAVKAKSNLADCNIRIHSNPPPPPTLLLQPSAKPLAFMLSSRSALTLSAFFTLALLPSLHSASLPSRSVLFRQWRSLPPRAVQTLCDSTLESPIRQVNFVYRLVTIEPSPRRSEIGIV